MSPARRLVVNSKVQHAPFGRNGKWGGAQGEQSQARTDTSACVAGNIEQQDIS